MTKNIFLFFSILHVVLADSEYIDLIIQAVTEAPTTKQPDYNIKSDFYDFYQFSQSTLKPPRPKDDFTPEIDVFGHTRRPSGGAGGIDDLIVAEHEEGGKHGSGKAKAYPNITAFFIRLRRTGYDPRVRPFILLKPVKVTCTIFISAISRISEIDQDFTADFYFRQTWTDPRLRWDLTHDEEDDLEEAIMIHSPEYYNYLWRPDTFFVNEKTAAFHYVTGLNSFLRIMPDGHITQSIRLTVRGSCPMNFLYFPLDHQRCPLYIESFSQPSKDIQYFWFRSNFDTSINTEAVAFSEDASSLLHFVIHGFRTLDTHSMRDGYNHSRLVLDIYLARNLGYYLIQIYMPASLIVVISWISFWIPRNSAPARVGLGVTTVLTMVTFTSMSFKTGLPNISYLKAMDIYMLMSFIMVFFALLEYAVVSYAEKKAKDASSLNKLMLGALSAVTANNLRKGSAMTVTSDGMNFECYVAHSLPSRIEWWSRFGFPAVYFVFNCVYWDHFLNNHLDSVENDVGFVDFNLD